MDFNELLENPELLQAIVESGYTDPTPIQQQAIPVILEGKDMLASAQTGTGKTAAFMLPSLQKISKPSQVKARGPRILILVPTRELAMQVAHEAAKYSKHLKMVKTVCIYGGAPYPVQNKQLSSHYEILVATPGRLIDHIERGRISFDRLELLILDEADRMLDMGFVDDVHDIAAQTPKNRQTLMFSATLKGNVLGLSKALLNNPVTITIAPQTAKHENIEQRLHNVDNLDHKYRLLDHLLNDEGMNQAVVFTSTKSQADVLVDKLIQQGHNAAALHGDMRQHQRTRTITKLRQGKIRILVATDVAARGIDVQTISHVINFDLPMNVEDYVHRIGRTGRAGSSGIALSFAAAKDMGIVGQIERFTGQKITSHLIPGFEPKFADRFTKASIPTRRYSRPKRRFAR
ncbi:MAG: DEAD/DEAH box helicase [Verrucomicrobia bacterium]|nr:DEAD/DEAH box helicase [Verrucomicrobiota bacterium]